ncbi:hypothetical protein FHT44_005044 [Mycolicibacterium sp. BK634]|uniref:hypothetical protein n=1 Tax=Mycolicibacterium sp. BK634 TaxID=2587099 RepID=UPI00161EBF2E|nr:hypothetical protein [Mycolicibacterium sp. BK634]MBB3752532.1 hypothetical protein [Mycolicibacterium sp. BK634]
MTEIEPLNLAMARSTRAALWTMFTIGIVGDIYLWLAGWDLIFTAMLVVFGASFLATGYSIGAQYRRDQVAINRHVESIRRALGVQ